LAAAWMTTSNRARGRKGGHMQPHDGLRRGGDLGAPRQPQSPTIGSDGPGLLGRLRSPPRARGPGRRGTRKNRQCCLGFRRRRRHRRRCCSVPLLRRCACGRWRSWRPGSRGPCTRRGARASRAAPPWHPPLRSMQGKGAKGARDAGFGFP
jgi:hypothetical protein